MISLISRALAARRWLIADLSRCGATAKILKMQNRRLFGASGGTGAPGCSKLLYAVRDQRLSTPFQLSLHQMSQGTKSKRGDGAVLFGCVEMPALRGM